MAALIDGIEPKAEEWWLGSAPATPTDAAVLSIAISIKRIADEVCGVPYDHAPGADNTKHRMGLTDGIMHAIEQGLLAASQRG